MAGLVIGSGLMFGATYELSRRLNSGASTPGGIVTYLISVAGSFWLIGGAVARRPASESDPVATTFLIMLLLGGASFVLGMFTS